jgi:hypothetical protein
MKMQKMCCSIAFKTRCPEIFPLFTATHFILLHFRPFFTVFTEPQTTTDASIKNGKGLGRLLRLAAGLNGKKPLVSHFT